MRILAIRGCNLASLAGEFEIDLAHGPLGGAGVFAIVGNTGAGKSTLLDAMCVALFDRTPRLSAPSRVQVGRGPDDPLALGANDVRGILRRGASTGWAEVDFESGDARQYRARWSVRRARGHSAGNLQDQQMSCVALDGGERLGGTKTETLRCIQQRLGLSFDQFRRSALLAQGDFATFLRADGKDRSELLERMTGTEIYSRLSIAAHLRATEAEQGLRDRRGAAAAIAVLDDDARSAMESELAGATAAKASARERFAAAEVYLRWAVEGARRAGELASADRAHSLALAAISDADAHRAELALRRRAETLRSTWDEAARVDRDHALAAGATSATAGLADAARGQCAEHTHRRSQLASAHAPIRAARIAAGIVERLAPPPALAGATAGAALGIAAVAQVEARVAKATEDAAWLVAHAGVAPEIAAWPEVDAKLAQHVALAETIAQLDRELAARATERSRLEASCAVAKAAQREASAQLELAQRKAATFRERRGGLTLDAARRQEDDARQRCVEVARLAAVAEAARLGVDARATLDREASTLETAAASDRDAGVAAASARAAADEVRVEREREIETLRRIAGHAHARTELVDGEACPLCGATEHPWEARGEMSTAIRDAERRLAQVKKRLEAAVAEVAALSARDTQRVAERARLASRRVALDHDATSAAVTWRAQLAALGELMLVDDPADPAAGVLAGERAVAAGASLEQTRAARAHVEAGVKAAADAQAQTLARQVELDHTTLRVADLECTRRELDVVLHRARGERAARSTHRSELALSILGALARWSPLPAEPAIRDALARLHRGLPRSLADSWPATDAAAALPRDARPSTPGAPSASSGGASTADATAGVSPRNAARETRGRAPRAGANRGDAHSDDASERQVREALEAEARLAGGRRPPEDAVDVSLEVGALLRVREAVRAVVEIWRRCADAVADADAAMSAALAVLDRSVGDAERELANAEARYAEALARRDALGLELAAIGARLEVARVAAGFDADELRRLLAADATRADQLADELASLDRAVERARAVVAERARELDEHLAAHPPGTPVDQPVRSTSAESNPADPHLTARAPGAVASFAGEHPVYATSAESSAALGRAREIEAGAVRRDAVCGLGPEAVASIGRVVEAARREVDDADARVARVAAELAADGAARGRKTSALAALAAAESACEVDRVLGEVIGSHDGKLFRSFAQSLTLDGLLAVANAHLEELAPRYQLERVPRHDLELQVIDRDLGAEVRSVHSLSGGESFLVSLALALGLSSMSAHDVRVRTLLIDEGFGTLDPSTLDTALAVLDRLQATGRQVGVISHVPALVERVGAHVRIIQRGGGRSEVVVADA